MLASGNAKVTTTGSGVQADNIRADAALGWPGAATLALDAYKSIAINRPVTVSGSGGVSLVTNDGGSGGVFWCGDKGRISFKNPSGTNDPGIKGLSNAQLQSGLPKGFSPRIWSEDADINSGLPYLIANAPGK